ncbi:MAG: pyruvate kinase [Chloroflexi bacterium]|uniref:Pyruvate kinase n=1 Tax=Candidatus Chlorohelix allophototropha TaxID=3003348 RepID=A0A8T7LVG6_9CHLR|nr:pyruvate kinase [Chloroflexota bacterium]WJW67878.1 pyruvate kinase [Chloroflexota bacterium L227-S17]
MTRRTKIVGTIGPASWDEPVLHRLIEEGLDVVRLNFSHAEHNKAAETIALVRRLANENERNVAILQDLQGPRIRTGKVAEKIQLEQGKEVVLTTQPDFVATSPDMIGVDYAGLSLDVKSGDLLLIEDGLFKLQVLHTTADAVHCVVIEGGLLGSHKGINVPGVTLGVPTITDKDKEDLRFGIEQDVDYVALSFVRQAEDVIQLRQLIQKYAGTDDPLHLPLIIAKIEKHEAIANFDAILAAADGIMVARGDLGVELPTEQIPVLQKRIIRKCNDAGKTVITATQMLDSMTRNPRPTRAEASDVANAIIDGSDATMLSGETASGLYPIEAVRVMSRIAETIEREWLFSSYHTRIHYGYATNITDAISQSVVDISLELGVSLILATSSSGSTARMISRCRPSVPLLVATAEERTYRRLALVWGTEAIKTEHYSITSEVVNRLQQRLLERSLVKPGDKIVVTGGLPVGVPGQTNMLRVVTIGQGI